jgi:hypothetical protein
MNQWTNEPMTQSTLDGRKGSRVLLGLQMISQFSYRYYCYYGPLSTWRDGWAMGCRETE